MFLDFLFERIICNFYCVTKLSGQLKGCYELFFPLWFTGIVSTYYIYSECFGFFLKFIYPKVIFFFNELKFFYKRNNVKECIVCYIFCPKVIM